MQLPAKLRNSFHRSEQMTHEKLAYMFSGFCAVSGSPVRPSDYNRYKLTLERADGSGKVFGVASIGDLFCKLVFDMLP